MAKQLTKKEREQFEAFKAEWPDWVEYFDFLDLLRESGTTNMFGAAPWLQEEYPDLTKREARQILSMWMKVYGKEGGWNG